MPLNNHWGNGTQDVFLRTDERLGEGVVAPLRVAQNIAQTDGTLYAVLLSEVVHKTEQLQKGVDAAQQVYSSNEFISFFNPHDDTTFENAWRLNIDASGGFRITFEDGSLSKFRISKTLHSFLGLQEALTYEETVLRAPEHKLQFTVHPVDANGDAEFLLGQNIVDNFHVVGVDFFGDAHTEADLAQHAGGELTVDGQRYHIDAVQDVNVGPNYVTKTNTSLPFSVTKNGVEYWEYLKPPKDSYITNTGTICVESLSEYEAIQIISRSGMMYRSRTCTSPKSASILAVTVCLLAIGYLLIFQQAMMEMALWRPWEMHTGVRASALWRPPMVKFWKHPVLETH